MPRKTAISIGELLKEYIRVNRLAKGLNTQRIFKAWEDASGAGKYTIRKFYRDGRLFITVDSSVVRSQLLFQREALVEKINSILAADELFTKDEPTTGYVRELIIK